jgi:hypothetical protein
MRRLASLVERQRVGLIAIQLLDEHGRSTIYGRCCQPSTSGAVTALQPSSDHCNSGEVVSG